MTKDEIILKAYNFPDIHIVVAKVCAKFGIGQNYADDLFHDCIIALSSKSMQELADIYSEGKLKYYFTRIIINQASWPESVFNLLHFNRIPIATDAIPETQEEPYDEYITDAELEELVAACDERNGYNQQLLRSYAELGSYRKVADRYGIPYVSVFNAITKAKKQILSKWKQ